MKQNSSRPVRETYDKTTWLIRKEAYTRRAEMLLAEYCAEMVRNVYFLGGVLRVTSVLDAEAAHSHMPDPPYVKTPQKIPFLSSENLILIAGQRPYATQVRSYGDWLSEHAELRRYENGIMQLGTNIYASKTGTDLSRWEAYTVYDISQTTKERPPMLWPLPDTEHNLDALLHVLPANAQIGNGVPKDRSLRWDPDKNRFVFRKNFRETLRFEELVTTVCTVLVAQQVTDGDTADIPFCANCAAWLLCTALGELPPLLDYPSEHVRSMSVQDLAACLDLARNASRTMLERMMRDISAEQAFVNGEAYPIGTDAVAEANAAAETPAPLAETPAPLVGTPVSPAEAPEHPAGPAQAPAALPVDGVDAPGPCESEAAGNAEPQNEELADSAEAAPSAAPAAPDEHADPDAPEWLAWSKDSDTDA